MGRLGDERWVAGLVLCEGADFGAVLGFRLKFAEFAHGFVQGVFIFTCVAMDAVEAFVVAEYASQGVNAEVADLGEDLDLGVAATFEVPGAFDYAFVEDIFESALGVEFFAEAGFKFGEVFFLAGEDDEVLGRQVVFDGVLGGCGFSGFSSWSGGHLGVGAVGGELLFGSHVVRVPCCGLKCESARAAGRVPHERFLLLL